MSSSLKSWATTRAKRVLGMPPGPRRYLRSGLTVEAFFRELDARGAQYAVLRWFDDLPSVARGEDIDLLVADESLPIIEALTRAAPFFPTTQKLDVYTVSGLPGTDFRAMPYLARRLAERLVTGAVRHKDLYRVPAPRDHFDSMAFHAVYHKGFASGLPEVAGAEPVLARPEHDYATVLAGLAEACGIRPEISLRGLDAYLREQGLRPASDTLERFQIGNPWLAGELDRVRPDIGALTGLIVYVVRERAEEFRDEIVVSLNRQGFEILKVFPLDARQRELATAAIRGGNWGRGPFRVSGGTPSSAIIAYDLGWDDGSGPLVNSRAVDAKKIARDLVAANFGSPDAFNPLHSTDNGWQSLEYLRALEEPELVTEVESAVTALLATVCSPWPVLRTLGVQGRRARVDVVDHPVHGESVLKVFRPGARGSWEREVAARSLIGDSALVPPLLDSGENWILTRFYSDTGRHLRRRLPGSREGQLRFTAASSLRAFVDTLRDRGLYMLDLTTHNLVSDPIDGMKILDLEFLQPYPDAVPELARDCTVIGLPGEVGEPLATPVWPTRTNWHNGVTRSLFRPAITGLPPAALARDSALLRARGGIVQLAWLAPFAAAAVIMRILETRVATRARDILRKVRK